MSSASEFVAPEALGDPAGCQPHRQGGAADRLRHLPQSVFRPRSAQARRERAKRQMPGYQDAIAKTRRETEDANAQARREAVDALVE